MKAVLFGTAVIVLLLVIAPSFASYIDASLVALGGSKSGQQRRAGQADESSQQFDGSDTGSQSLNKLDKLGKWIDKLTVKKSKLSNQLKKTYMAKVADLRKICADEDIDCTVALNKITKAITTVGKKKQTAVQQRDEWFSAFSTAVQMVRDTLEAGDETDEEIQEEESDF